MNLIQHIKWHVKTILESHPIGYYIGNKVINMTDAFLPHEEDFHGFKKLFTDNNGLFLDIGANDGKSARSFHKLFQDWKIFSVEANSLHVPTLTKLKNKLSGFDFIIGAIGDKNQELTLYTPIYKNIVIHSAASIDLNQVKRQMKKQFRKQTILDNIRFEQTTAKAIHLDDLNLAPQIIKIDIEGMEHIALENLEKTILKNNPTILVEYNPANFDRILHYMSDKGYLACGYNIAEDQIVKFQVTHRNCFFIPKEKEGLITTNR